MKALAIMQNMWVRDPARVTQMIESVRAKEGEEAAKRYRRRLISYALFAGCKSGRILQKAFGTLCDDIIWEEASPKIGGYSSSVFPPDLVHIRAAIQEVQPRVIIAFGEVARKGVSMVAGREPVIFAPHPAARRGVMAELETAARLVRASLL